MTEPDEPQIQRLSVFAFAMMLALLLVVLVLQRGYERSIRSQVSAVQWTEPWEHLAKRRADDYRVLTTRECDAETAQCRIPIDEAMDLLAKHPERLYPWSPEAGEP
jgi:hypothetical protein